MKKLLILLLLVPTLAMSGTFKDEDGKFGLKTKKSGFKFHLNFMDHKDHNFQYIKDKTKARAGNYFQRFELRDDPKVQQKISYRQLHEEVSKVANGLKQLGVKKVIESLYI